MDRSINTWWSGQQMSTEQVLSISQRRPKNKKYDSLMVFVCLWLMVKTNIWLPHFCPRKRSVAKIEEINLLILGGKNIFLLSPIKISSIFITFLELLQETKSFMPNEIFLQNAAMSRLKSILSNFGFFTCNTGQHKRKLWQILKRFTR